MKAASAKGARARIGALIRAAACAALAASCAAPPAASPTTPLVRYDVEREAMGTRFAIAFYAADPATAARASQAAIARIDEIDARLSDWIETSEVGAAARAAAATPPRSVAIGQDLLRELRLARRGFEATDGLLDVTVGPLVKLWRRSRRQGELPGAEALARARAAIGFEKLVIDEAAGTLSFRVPGMQLDFGSIAEGDAADEVLRLLQRDFGIDRALVDAGGDLAASGPPPGEEGWLVGLASLTPDPAAPPIVRDALRLAHGGLGTSGDAFRWIEIDGVRYSHLVDPRTGLGLTRRVLASTLAPDGATADLLASAASLVGPEGLPRLLAAFPGSSARLQTIEGGEVRACASAGWPPMMAAPPSDDEAQTGAVPRRM